MKIAVTGASGHVGGNLCRELIRQGHKVKALVHNDDRSIRGLNMEFIRGDLASPSSLTELCRDAEIVFHLAAIISIEGKKNLLERINIEGTSNLLEAIKKSSVRRLIHFSSIHALDNTPLDRPMDESRPLVTHALMMYEATKASGDKLVQDSIARGLDAVIINPTAIIGPNDFKPSLVGQVLLRLYKGTLPALVPGGYDWVDVRDVTQGAIAAMEKGGKGQRYILSGNWLSVKDLALLMEEVTGRRMVRLSVPISLAKAGVPFFKVYSLVTRKHPLYTFQSLEVLMNGNRLINNQKARNELGYSPRPLRETITDAIQWFRENNYIQ